MLINKLAVVETWLKIRMNLSLSLIEHLTLKTGVAMELQLAIILISAQYEVFCDHFVHVALHPDNRVHRLH